jgi:uncharacterized membrane protein YccC
MTLRTKNLIVYTGKCMSGVLLCYIMSLYLSHWIDYPWSLISVLLVLSPEGTDALELALTRMKANLVGACVGVLILFSDLPTPWNMMVGAGLSLFACDRLKLNTGARSTLVAMIIILLHSGEAHPWDAGLSRVLAVVTGCLLGLGITFIFHSLIHLNTPALNSEAMKKEREG